MKNHDFSSQVNTTVVPLGLQPSDTPPIRIGPLKTVAGAFQCVLSIGLNCRFEFLDDSKQASHEF